MRRITFPRLVGRTYGFRTLPLALTPKAPDVAPMQNARQAGGFSNTQPASRAIIDRDSGSPGRSFLGRTEDALNLGPVPGYIDRETAAANAGKIGVGAGPDGIGGWPYDGNALYLPHQRIPRKPITVTAFARTIDTSVRIPAVGIGAPVE